MTSRCSFESFRMPDNSCQEDRNAVLPGRGLRRRSAKGVCEHRKGMVNHESHDKCPNDAQKQHQERVPRLRRRLVFQGFAQHGSLLYQQENKYVRDARIPCGRIGSCVSCHNAGQRRAPKTHIGQRMSELGTANFKRFWHNENRRWQSDIAVRSWCGT